MMDIYLLKPGQYDISIRHLGDESMAGRLDHIEAMLTQLTEEVNAMNAGVQQLQAQIDALAAEESQRADTEQSAINALQFLLGKVQEAMDTTNSLPALQAQLASLVQAGTERTATLAAAVAAVPSDAGQPTA